MPELPPIDRSLPVNVASPAAVTAAFWVSVASLVSAISSSAVMLALPALLMAPEAVTDISS